MESKQQLWVAIGLGAALVLGGGAAVVVLTAPPASAHAGALLTGTVRQGSVSAGVSTTGNVAPVSETAVGFAVGGTIATLDVQDGQTVQAGQTIATIGTAALSGQLTDAQAALSSDETALSDAQTALTAAESTPSTTAESVTTRSGTSGAASGSGAASASSASSASGVDQAQTQVLADQAKVTSDQTAVTDAQTAVGEATLTAPVSGEVVAVSGAVGQTVSGTGSQTVSPSATGSTSTSGGSGSGGSGSGGSGSGGTNGSSGTASSTGSGGVVTIADTSHDVVTTDVPESEVGALKTGQTASVTYPAASGVTSTATVTAIAPVGTSSAGVVVFPVTVTLAALPSGVRYGDTADVTVTTQSSPASALSVPAAAIHTSGSGSYVDVVTAGTTKRVPVTTGVVGTTGTQVSGSGLRAGETISLGTAAATTGTGTGASGTGFGGGSGFGSAGLGGGTGFGGTRGGGAGRRGQPDRRRGHGQRRRHGRHLGRRTMTPTATAPRGPAIELLDVHQVYGTGDGAVHALRGIDLVVERGEYVAVVGPSGSGKSTLMNILGCLDVPTHGVHRLGGTDVRLLAEDDLARVRNRDLGFVFQSFNLVQRMTALANVALPLAYGGVGRVERTRRARTALERVGLADRADHAPVELSGGQQQRVAIARALVTEPTLILADEPTGNLDSRATADVLDLLDSLADEHRTIVVITHEEEVSARAHRVLTIADGRIVADERTGNARRTQAGVRIGGAR